MECLGRTAFFKEKHVLPERHSSRFDHLGAGITFLSVTKVFGLTTTGESGIARSYEMNLEPAQRHLRFVAMVCLSLTLCIAAAQETPTSRSQENFSLHQEARPGFSTVDWTHAGFDAFGLGFFVLDALRFHTGYASPGGSEAGGHEARTGLFVIYQPLRTLIETPMELAAWNHYRGTRRYEAITAYMPSLKGWVSDAMHFTVPKKTEDWLQHGGLMYGLQSSAGMGPWLETQSHILFRAHDDGDFSNVCLYGGQGIGHGFGVGNAGTLKARIFPSLKYGVLYRFASTHTSSDDETYKSTAFLFGPQMSFDLTVFGRLSLSAAYGLQMGPGLRYLHIQNSITGANGNFSSNWGWDWDDGLEVAQSFTFGAGVAF